MTELDPDAIERINATLGTALGSDLAAHLQRDVVMLVSPPLGLLDCAMAVARDDAAAVSAWLATGALRRPDPTERDLYLATPERQWRSVVVQPWVFIQSLD